MIMKSSCLRVSTACLAFSMIASTGVLAQSTSNGVADDTAQVRGKMAIRAVSAAIGWFPGAFVGGYVGYHLLGHSPCGCDDPGLSEALIGVAIGGTLGASLGAALPGLKSHCSFGQRWARGLAGAVIGMGLGMIPLTQGAQIITVPLFSSIGAGVAQGRC